VLDFADNFGLKIAGTWFVKDDEGLMTYESGSGRGGDGAASISCDGCCFAEGFKVCMQFERAR